MCSKTHSAAKKLSVWGTDGDIHYSHVPFLLPSNYIYIYIQEIDKMLQMHLSGMAATCNRLQQHLPGIQEERNWSCSWDPHEGRSCDTLLWYIHSRLCAATPRPQLTSHNSMTWSVTDRTMLLTVVCAQGQSSLSVYSVTKCLHRTCHFSEWGGRSRTCGCTLSIWWGRCRTGLLPWNPGIL